jgi:hypothetical protein
LTNLPRQTAAQSAAVCVFAAALTLASVIAAAQDVSAKPHEDTGFFATIGRWFEEQNAKFNSNLKTMGSGVDNFGREAGIAAKTTVDGAKDAADAMVRIPAARVMRGHEKCSLAPNGAPDCLAAAKALCKGKGFETGKSVDMTTAEICPAQVYLSGRDSGKGCHTETFVSRALCQ